MVVWRVNVVKSASRSLSFIVLPLRPLPRRRRAVFSASLREGEAESQPSLFRLS